MRSTFNTMAILSAIWELTATVQHDSQAWIYGLSSVALVVIGALIDRKSE